MTDSVYKVEDIFKEIPGDEDNVLMQIPPEVIEQMGWNPGDTIHVTVLENGSISITRKEDE